MSELSPAPVVIFGYNRYSELNRLMESLAVNPESNQTEVYIYIDGPRGDLDSDKVAAVRNYALSLEGTDVFKKVTVKSSVSNKGLARSVIDGVSEIIGRHRRAIILEDDLQVQPNFLHFMNLGLDKYQHEKKVYSICGYTNKVAVPRDYLYDAYFCTRSSSWGWATWADRWNTVDWTFARWEEWKRERAGFNSWGGSDCFSMLDACRKGENSSWAIRFCFAQYLRKGVSLFPVKSLVTNNGFDGNGTNCRKWSRFRHELEEASKYDFKMPDNVAVNDKLYRSAMSYNGLLIRVWSRLMYIISK